MAKRIDINDADYTMLQPTGDRILIKRDAGEEKTESGIYFAREVNKNPGTVIAIGDGEVFEKENNRITVGAKVYFLEEGYVPIGDFMLMKTTSVLGVFN